MMMMLMVDDDDDDDVTDEDHVEVDANNDDDEDAKRLTKGEKEDKDRLYLVSSILHADSAPGGDFNLRKAIKQPKYTILSCQLKIKSVSFG